MSHDLPSDDTLVNISAVVPSEPAILPDVTVETPSLSPSVSVVVITLSRPDYLRRCLAHIDAQTVAPAEVIVVDASPDDRTYQLVTEEYPHVRFVRNRAGRGTMGLSRNLGFAEVTAGVVAFIDDDAYAEPSWLDRLLSPYADPTVGGVGGRARNGIPGEERTGVADIGRFHDNGTLSGYFAADPGAVMEVDHVLGANMSFRTQVLRDLGGIRDGYPGTCLREDTDLAFRVRLAGWKLLYQPTSVVNHVAAPYAKGRRFDLRYTYYANRNHVVLLARTLGFTDPRLRRFLGVSLREAGGQLNRAIHAGSGTSPIARTIAGGTCRAAAGTGGLLVGAAAAYRQRRSDRKDLAGHSPRLDVTRLRSTPAPTLAGTKQQA